MMHLASFDASHLGVGAVPSVKGGRQEYGSRTQINVVNIGTLRMVQLNRTMGRK
jgi:hypothetical protein